MGIDVGDLDDLTLEELTDAVKAAGHDDINMELLKYCMENTLQAVALVQHGLESWESPPKMGRSKLSYHYIKREEDTNVKMIGIRCV